MSAVMDLVLPHLERWEDIEVLSDTWEPLYVFLERCNRAGAYLSSQFSEKGIPKAGNLRRFALSRCNAYFALEGTHFAPKPLFCATVTLAGVHVDWTRTPLRNLTEFSLKYHAQGVLPTPRELVSILRSSPNLERLCILGWGVCSIDDETSFSNLEGTVVLRNLQELNFGWVGIQHSLKLLSLFSWHMPKLRALALEDVANSLDPIFTQDSSVVLDYIFSMLSTSNKRSGAPSTSHVAVEELSLHSTRFSADSCRRLLLCLQNLKDLTLHNVGDAFLMSLFPSNGAGVCEATLCPKLSRVVIRDADGVSPSMLEYFMEARDPRQIISDTGASSAGSFNAPIIIEIEDLYDSDMDLFEVDPHDGSEDEFISRDSLFSDENIDGDDEYEGDDEDDSEESYYTAPSPSSHDDGALDPAVELYENHLEEDAIGSHGGLLHESSQRIVTGDAVAEKPGLHAQ
ncbi:hypothetical protein DFH11DRAFT_1546753 [Phellopilus nigrolimitatus]|nr:hypothetical protein DFH11DRAFT_1546753 [Phellopilus nigrolimitatus]